MHLPKGSRMRLQGRSENRKKDTQENKTEATGSGWGSQWNRASLWCASQLHTHAGVLSSTDPGARAACMRNKDQEVGLGNGGLGFRLPEWRAPLLAARSSDGHPTPGASSAPASICFQNSPETTTQARRGKVTIQMKGRGKPGVLCPCASPMAISSLHVGISKSWRGLPCEWIDVFHNNQEGILWRISI